MGNLSRFFPTAVLSAFCAFVAASLRSRAALQIEILALRHQLNVLQRSVKRPRLSAFDRWLWVRLSSNWPGWRAALKLLKPATVIGWHCKGFRLFWTWKCRHGRPGRPAVSQEIRKLIRRMSRENPLWGAPKIHGELLKLGFDISETSVSKYLVRRTTCLMPIAFNCCTNSCPKILSRSRNRKRGAVSRPRVVGVQSIPRLDVA